MSGPEPVRETGGTRVRRILSPYHLALTHPVLRPVLPGVALSALGDGMSVVAIAWLALRLSHSALLVGAASRRTPCLALWGRPR